jgi:hypothetical protein
MKQQKTSEPMQTGDIVLHEGRRYRVLSVTLGGIEGPHYRLASFGDDYPNEDLTSAALVTRADTSQLAPLLRELGSRGGKARAANLTQEQRSASGRKAARARWKGNKKTKRGKTA